MQPELMKHIVALADYQAWAQAYPNLASEPQSFCDMQQRMVHILCAIPVLWPDFVIVDDLLLRKDALPDDWEAFQQSANDAGWLPFQIEYVVNHVHMEDLFWHDPNYPQFDPEASDYLATTLAEMWRAKLQLQFPDRTMVVEVNNLGNLPEVGAFTRP